MDTNKIKSVLLVIDGQNDFVLPNGALPVKGAVDDMERLAAWIKTNKTHLDKVIVSFDTHHRKDISHPTWFINKAKQHPQPGTIITADSVEQKYWTPKHFKKTLEYLRTIEKKGQQHMIWPEHCIANTSGWQLYAPLLEAILEWQVSSISNEVETVLKGLCIHTEQFGIFRANVPLAEYPGTDWNHNLLSLLSQYDRIFIAGEAASHCVAFSIEQLLEYDSSFAAKLCILTDCSSNVILEDGTDLGFLTKSIYDKASELGSKFCTTDSEVFK